MRLIKIGSTMQHANARTFATFCLPACGRHVGYNTCSLKQSYEFYLASSHCSEAVCTTIIGHVTWGHTINLKPKAVQLSLRLWCGYLHDSRRSALQVPQDILYYCINQNDIECTLGLGWAYLRHLLYTGHQTTIRRLLSLIILWPSLVNVCTYV